MDHTREAMRLIRSLAAEDGLAVLMGCSDEEPAMRAHRIWRLEEGELTLDEPSPNTTTGDRRQPPPTQTPKRPIAPHPPGTRNAPGITPAAA